MAIAHIAFDPGDRSGNAAGKQISIQRHSSYCPGLPCFALQERLSGEMMRLKQYELQVYTLIVNGHREFGGARAIGACRSLEERGLVRVSTTDERPREVVFLNRSGHAVGLTPDVWVRVAAEHIDRLVAQKGAAEVLSAISPRALPAAPRKRPQSGRAPHFAPVPATLSSGGGADA